MPTDAVWIVVTIPKKEHEKERRTVHKSKKRIRYEGHLDSNKNEVDEEESLEDILTTALALLGIEEVSWVASKNDKYYQVYFHTDLYDNDATLAYLQSKGIGVRGHSSVGYIPFGLFYSQEEPEDESDEEELKNVFSTRDSVPATDVGQKLDIGHHKMHGFKKLQGEFLKSVTSRLTVAQVVEGVRSSSEMTFDFVMYALFAGAIAAAGLLNNSAVDVAAAMMIEPVMATVIAMTFGIVVQDRELTWTGIRSCFLSLLICLLVGYVYGAIVFIWWAEWDPPPTGIWPTPEMQVRGLWRTLWYGALQALAAGGAVAVTLLNDNQAALVGVAVASTFLPPFINTGLLWAGQMYKLPEAWAPMGNYQPVYYADMRWEFMALSGVSMIFTFVNVICMIACGCLLLWIKEVVPLGSLEPNKRFFKEDIKVARNYNRRMTLAAASGGPIPSDETMGNQILSEWAEIAGLDPKALLSDSPEARVTQLQTLQDILSDVELDDTYMSVTRTAVGKPGDNLVRRMTMASLGIGGGDLRKRKSSARPMSTTAGSEAPGVFDVESNLATVKSQRSYTISSKRRGSKWLPSPIFAVSDNPSPSPALTIGSNGSVARFSFDDVPVTRGLRPQDLEDKSPSAVSSGRRRSSVLLQKSLKDTDHSPFSVWPSSGGPGRFIRNAAGQSDLRRRSMAGALLARRMSKAPRLSTHSEQDS